MQQTARRIGRPRSASVIARDEAIYQLIAEGVASRSALAAATGHDRDAVYLSCKRLEQQGRIRKCLGDSGSAAWSVADGTPCP
ncbi:hypothetical protein PV733_37100 [Streptomyces europaeiscabiei]|uniref:Uncharacterized protein n=1 Tax=Streptomyces europaeiscabiei TaxID=146819 RepID=A0ABU4NYY9_9ACTN|nr:hypothetical protein [Streptomyces europaeiscabiei]MDX2759150.1 hypothetical protein [Streptomyces europaeiscabiei]MDX3549776.1 hypothetical protein [Streptomyces europaeiscabiei]MDX3558750.1 hypothetical protein [Streptomyces europaeiscabiei]MDX3707117.1 hypothetical protein [Streptomyces europaeiscabiei]MDX3714451.1 hypothetical protein [Streptomyces europaeiscabiei]